MDTQIIIMDMQINCPHFIKNNHAYEHLLNTKFSANFQMLSCKIQKPMNMDALILTRALNFKSLYRRYHQPNLKVHSRV